MEACEPLDEYAWLVDSLRRNQDKRMNLDAAVDASLDEMPDHYVIKPFLIGNRAEVKSMLFTEYNEEKVKEKERQEGRIEGRKEGRIEELLGMVRDGLISYDIAARRAKEKYSIEKEDFREMFEKYNPEEEMNVSADKKPKNL